MRLPSEVLCGIRAAMLDCWPHEVCGFWVRSIPTGQPIIADSGLVHGAILGDSFRRIPNLSGAAGEFLCDDRLVNLIAEDIMAQGQEIIAFLHTHETGCESSDTDSLFGTFREYPAFVVVISERQDQ